MAGVSDPTPERPRQVTMAGWLIMVGSVFALGLVVERLSGLHTLETQEKINRFLSTPPGSDLGVGTDTAVTVIRTLAMVTAGCATAAGILGFHVLRRSRSARVAVTILAVPIFFAGMVTGGFITSVVAASAAILWLQPARSWFDGKPPPERRTAPVPVPVAAVAPPPAPGAAVFSAPPPVSDRPPAAVSARPPAVLWACVLTWVCTAMVTIGLVASAVALAAMSDRIIDDMYRRNPDLAAQGVSDDLLIAATCLMIAGLVVWCVSAAAVAILVFRGVEWARIVLVVSAALCSVCCLVGAAVGAFVLLLPLVVSASCIAMLLRADSRPWFDRRTTPTGPPSPGGPSLPR
jgi:hypothetical protein